MYHKFIISLYRFVAFGILITIIGVVISYMGVLAFYTLNDNWISPTIISQSDEKMITLTAGILNIKEQILKYEIELKQAEASLVLLKEKGKVLNTIKTNLRGSIEGERTAMAAKLRQLKEARAKKAIDVANASRVAGDVAVLEAKIEKEFKAGLITQAEREKFLMSSAQFRTGVLDNTLQLSELDSSIDDLSRRINTLGGVQLSDIKSAEALFRELDTRTEVIQNMAAMETAHRQVSNAKEQIKHLGRTITALESSPYYKVVTLHQKHNYAFVAYENEQNAELGVPVFGCYLHMIFCRKVGEVIGVSRNEEIARHPIFRSRDIRGFLVEINFDDPNHAKSNVLFLRYKPLLF